MLSNLDYQIFHFINEQANSFSVLNGLMRFFAEDAQYVFSLALLLYWFSRNKLNRKMIISAVVSVCLGMGISFIIGHLVYRDRPFVTHAAIQLIKHPANASFPSDHAIGAFALAVTFWLYGKRFRLSWLAVALLIGFSRIWAGVHYPSDIAAGALIGTLCAVSTRYLLLRFKRPQQLADSCLKLYEKVEHKIWSKSTKPQSEDA
ncbi:bacitracin transport permease BCRC [Paenibacillus terrae HPL-003]|uniref:Bacitracin transport permease BCRC n=1 Tax=Paenibacillus terrae (strain HPL-003) TaxID=985665 RepID=G7VR00_PAETH|nr:undecaprenyl-diphosphatase [Paenibacillus terrae]AET61259.1 bacitracin transport permease BCRC [Paenibacillus terrae HPL-003]